METVTVPTIYEVLGKTAAKNILMVSQSIEYEPGYEDRQKVELPKLRGREAKFQADLISEGIRTDLIAGQKLTGSTDDLAYLGPFDLAVVMGELSYQSIYMAVRLISCGFKQDIYVELSKETIQNTKNLEMTEKAAIRHGHPHLLRKLVYLGKAKAGRTKLAFEIPLLPANVIETAIPVRLAKPKRPPAQFIEQSSDIAEPPKRLPVTTMRIIRDTQTARSLKALYDSKCQICSMSIKVSANKNYSETHHIRPLGLPHTGTDTNDNMLVLCPNHHAMFDFGMPFFASDDTIVILGKKYPLTKLHTLSQDSIAYHNTQLYRPSM